MFKATELNSLPIEASQGQIRRQTDKALLIQVVTGRGNIAEVWFPRSQIEIKGTVAWVADWLVAKKSAEIGGIITLDRSIARQMEAA